LETHKKKGKFCCYSEWKTFSLSQTVEFFRDRIHRPERI
jgi:hypothetical protein